MNEYPDEIEIEVTQKDIDKGGRCAATRCPITLAAKRLFGDKCITTCKEEIHIFAYEILKYSMTKESSQFVESFDRGHKVIPFKFKSYRIKS